MSDRLPPEIAALVPNGDQVVVADLTLEQVRVILTITARALRAHERAAAIAASERRPA